MYRHLKIVSESKIYTINLHKSNFSVDKDVLVKKKIFT